MNKFIEAIYKAKFWEELSPVTKINAEMIAPNVLHTNIIDNIKLIKIPIEMEGELVLIDKGEEEGKGRLIEFNVRKNKNVKKLEGNLRIKELSGNASKLGIYIHKFILSDNFLSLFGRAAELTLRSKLTGFLRNLEKFCKNNDLNEFL